MHVMRELKMTIALDRHVTPYFDYFDNAQRQIILRWHFRFDESSREGGGIMLTDQ